GRRGRYRRQGIQPLERVHINIGFLRGSRQPGQGIFQRENGQHKGGNPIGWPPELAAKATGPPPQQRQGDQQNHHLEQEIPAALKLAQRRLGRVQFVFTGQVLVDVLLVALGKYPVNNPHHVIR